MALSPEQIFTVADELHAEGERPTTIKVYQRLGRGSMNTVQKYLREWRPKEGAPEVAAAEMPDAIKDAVTHCGRELWRRMSGTTQVEIAAARGAADEEVQRVQGEFDALVTLVDDLEARCDRATSDAERLSAALEAEKTARAAVAATLKEKDGYMMTLHAEREDARNDAHALTHTLATTRERNQTLDGKLQGLISEHQSLEEELRNRLSDMHRFRDERDDARREVKAREQVEEELRRSLAKEEARGVEVEKKLDDLTARFTEEVARRAALEERHLTRKA